MTTACSSRPIAVGSSQARRELRGARACRGQAERCVFLSHSCPAQGHQRLHALRQGRRALPRSTSLSRCPVRRRARATQEHGAGERRRGGAAPIVRRGGTAGTQTKGREAKTQTSKEFAGIGWIKWVANLMNWMRRSRATLLFSYLRKFAVTITRALTDGTVQQNRNKSMARLVTCTSPHPCCPCV